MSKYAYVTLLEENNEFAVWVYPDFATAVEAALEGAKASDEYKASLSAGYGNTYLAKVRDKYQNGLNFVSEGYITAVVPAFEACEHDRTRMDDGISSCLDCGDRIDCDVDET